MTALAVMLMAFVIAQGSVTQLDHWLHDTGQAHVATPLASALLDEHHDHGQDAAAVKAQAAQPDDSTAPPPAHHHHDAPSAVALPASPAMMAPWSSSIDLAPVSFRDPPGAMASRQDRPPRTALEPFA